MPGGIRASRRPAWPVGHLILDLYQVREFLGEGRLGQIYRTYHRGWGTALAIRRPHPVLLSKPGARQDWLRGAEMWLGLAPHPNLATCAYVRLHDDLPLLFSEYGESTLALWMDDNRLYAGTEVEILRRVLDIAIQTAWGLQAMHDHGLVHGNLKPANILLRSGGGVRLTDLGLIAPGSLHRHATREYAAPEQLLYPQADAMRTADAWGWATTVAHMFMVRPPTTGPGIARDLEAWHQAPLNKRLPMPDEVFEVLSRCLLKDPGSRPASLLPTAEKLMAVYTHKTGSLYPRRPALEASDHADLLNDQAICRVDLGAAQEVEPLLASALQVHPGHAEATYNLGLLRWRRGDVSDLDVLDALPGLSTDDTRVRQMMASIHLERGDVESANFLLGDLPPTPAMPHWCNPVTGCHMVCVLEAGSQPLQAVALSADGTLAATASRDGRVRLWNVDAGTCERTIEHGAGVQSLVLVGNSLLFGTANGQVCRGSLDVGEVIHVLEGHAGGVRALAATRDGSLVVSGCDRGLVRLWKPTSGTPACDLSAGFAPVLALATTGTHVAVATATDLSVWKTGDRCMLWRLSGGRHAVHFDATGQELWSADDDGQVRVRDASTGALHRVLTEAGPWLAVAPLRAVTATSRSLRVWDPSVPRRVLTLSEDAADLQSLALTADGRRFAAGRLDGCMVVWDMPLSTSPAPLLVSRARIETDDAQVVKTVLREAWAAIRFHDWAGAVEAGLRAHQIDGYQRSADCLQLWTELARRLPRADFREAWPRHRLEGHQGPVPGVQFLPDGRHAMTAGTDGTLRRWRLDSGACTRQWKGHDAPIVSLQVAAETAASLDEHGTLAMWDLETGRLLTSVPSAAGTLALSGDGSTVLLGEPGRVQVLSGGQRVRTLHTPCTALAISVDGRWAATGTEDGSAHLWSVHGGHRVLDWSDHSGAVRALAIAADGHRLVSAGDDNTIRVYDLRNGTCLHVLEGHSQSIASVALTADARGLVSGARDRQVRIWDLVRGTSVARLARHADRVLAVAVTPLGHRLVSSGQDGVIQEWSIDWNVQTRAPADWDEGARPCLEAFVATHDCLTQRSPDFDALLRELAERGYGWLNPRGVFQVLREMTGDQSRAD